MPAAATPTGRTGYKWALRTAEMLADYDVEWFEEPLQPDALRGLRRAARARAGADRRRRGADAPAGLPALARGAAPSTSCSRTSPRSAASARSGASAGWRRSTACGFIPHGWNTAVGLAADLQLASALPAHRSGRVHHRLALSSTSIVAERLAAGRRRHAGHPGNGRVEAWRWTARLSFDTPTASHCSSYDPGSLARRAVGFADESLAEGGVGGDVGPQDLEGFLAGESGVLGEVDLAYSSAAELAHDGVCGEQFAWPQRHAGELHSSGASAPR